MLIEKKIVFIKIMKILITLKKILGIFNWPLKMLKTSDVMFGLLQIF